MQYKDLIPLKTFLGYRHANTEDTSSYLRRTSTVVNLDESGFPFTGELSL